MRVAILSFFCLTLACCNLEFRTIPRPVNVSYGVVVDTYYESCYEEPYYHSPLWCDWYDDGTTCCVWMVDGWYEEWCQWQDDWCWEYLGAW